MRVEYYNNKLTIEAGWLIKMGYWAKHDYDNLVQRRHIKVERRGCRNTPALVVYDSLPLELRKQLELTYGNPRDKALKQSYFEEKITADSQALEFYSNYLTPSGDHLPHEKQIEYYNNAIILNAFRTLINDKRTLRKALGGKTTGIFDLVAKSFRQLNTAAYPHTLPSNERRLKIKYQNYLRDSYVSLVHKSYGNSFAKKVDKELERLILSIYCMSNKPYSKWVHEDYLAFIAGVYDVVDMKSGLIFDRADFWDAKKDTYIIISENTCWNYINKPKNRAIVDAVRMDRHKYAGNVRPHHHRHAPRYAFSKISLDDRDLPHKMEDGSRIKAYYAYDVASGALIGVSYSLKKDTELFINCIRDMFRFISTGGWGMPLEVEVEHHLVKNYKDDLMKAGLIFPFVRWCAPGNSQEKHAEQLNRQKKYGYEKRYQDGIGRFYSKLEANQTGGERVYDDVLNKYVIREKTYTYEQIIADEKFTIQAYNNGLHRNQKEYPRKTRMQVLLENVNPNLSLINQALLLRYIGECTTTSIHRNMYCQVNYQKYMLPSPKHLEKLSPGNYTVQAYWLPESDNVYLYQHDNFIAECQRIETYNTAIGERSEKDYEALSKQSKYIAEYDKLIKDAKEDLHKPQFIESMDKFQDIEVEAVDVSPFDDDKDDFDISDLDYTDVEYMRELAIINL